jgi:hypothetical protein
MRTSGAAAAARPRSRDIGGRCRPCSGSTTCWSPPRSGSGPCGRASAAAVTTGRSSPTSSCCAEHGCARTTKRRPRPCRVGPVGCDARCRPLFASFALHGRSTRAGKSTPFERCYDRAMPAHYSIVTCFQCLDSSFVIHEDRFPPTGVTGEPMRFHIVLHSFQIKDGWRALSGRSKDVQGRSQTATRIPGRSPFPGQTWRHQLSFGVGLYRVYYKVYWWPWSF